MPWWLSVLLLGVAVSLTNATTNKDDDDKNALAACTLYLAPSSILNNRLGLYSAIARQPGDILESTADVCLPFIDLYWHQPHFANHHLYKNDTQEESYFWVTSHGRSMGMLRESVTGTVDAWCPGWPSLVQQTLASSTNDENHDGELAINVNVHTMTPVYNDMKLQRGHHAAAGGRSPYGVSALRVAPSVPAGGELVQFSNTLLPTHPRHDADVDVGHDDNNDSTLTTTKTLDWLQQHGRCVDSIQGKPSTLRHAGMGAFARHDIRQGQIIATSPVRHFAQVDYRIMEMYNITEEPKYYPQDDEEEFEEGDDEDTIVYMRRVEELIHHQIAVNYCFSHDETTLLVRVPKEERERE